MHSARGSPSELLALGSAWECRRTLCVTRTYSPNEAGNDYLQALEFLEEKLNVASAKFSIGCGDLLDRIADSSRRTKRFQSIGIR